MTIRPLEIAIPPGVTGVVVTRRILAALMAGFGQRAYDVEVTPVDSEIRRPATDDAGLSVRRVKGEWAKPAAPRPGGVVLYIHGSGYSLCSTATHRALVTQIARHARLTVFSAAYRLAPEHVFPAAADDVERAYGWVLEQGWSPGQVVVAGDSAGGHLALDLVLQLRRTGRELPAGLVMFSPVADLTFGLCRIREQARRDPMVSAEGARRLVAHYLADTDPAHPRLTHVIGPGEVLPPTLIQAGGAEMLAADARHLHQMLTATGTDSTLEIWPGQMHVFQAAPRAVPEAHRALRRAGRFMVDALAARAAAAEDHEREVSA